MKVEYIRVATNCIGALLGAVHSLTMLSGNPDRNSSRLLVILNSRLRRLSTLLVRQHLLIYSKRLQFQGSVWIDFAIITF